jgi:transposase-like protein
MEPVFMILGQSAATAACLSLDQNIAVQDLAYEQLQAKLLEDGQVLELVDPDAVSSRKLEGVVEVDEIYQTCGMKGQAEGGGEKNLDREPRSRGKKKGPGRGHYDKDTPVLIAWVSRAGKVVLQVLRDFTSDTVEDAAMRAVEPGSTIYSDSASSYKVLSEAGYKHDYVNHSKGEYARGEVHENRSECMFSLLKPYIWVFRGISKQLLPAYIAFFQFLRNFRELNCFGKAELILQAGLDPEIARKARNGEYARIFIQPLMEGG